MTKTKIVTKLIKNSSLSLMSLVFTGLIICGGFYFYALIHLPDVRQLKDMSMQLPLRIYSSDGKLIGEFGEKKRIPITLEEAPKSLIHAILDTEDQRFYEHRGVDFWALLRATIAYIKSGKKSQGASTITMQVAREYFFNRQKTFGRKINEILLAFRIDSTFNKKEVLELYLNKIYFGNRAYGVASAAQVYYGKKLNELTLPEMAMIAGLPQAPSRANPIANPEDARERRNHVLQRMLENNHISQAAYNAAIAAPTTTNYHESQAEVPAPYAAEMARNMVVSQYGDNTYASGIKIYTTIDSRLQKAANQALHDGILAYDQRHGYRGPEGHLAPANNAYWRRKLQNIVTINDLQPAAILSTSNNIISALLANSSIIQIPANNFTWTQTRFTRGDIIRVYKNIKNQWALAQIPKIEGAIIALDPKNGAILAISGGFSFASGNYNRAIQAERQAGSAFKPFIYSAALEKGITLASIINDAPIVLVDQWTKKEWRPQNVTQTFRGPTRLRDALVHSINLVSIRLLQNISVPYAVNYLKNFGFEGPREVPPSLSLALGSGGITPLKMATGYAVFANGGYKVTPFIIDHVIEADRKGEKIVLKTKPSTIPEANNPQNKMPEAPQVITPQNAYLITDVLKDVIKHGTAVKALALNREDLAGKTGTTNEQVDAWFSGFNSDLVATVWFGFDHPQSTHEYGSHTPLAIWIDFMHQALANQPLHSIKRPDDIITVKIDPTTGFLADPEQDNAIFEIFTASTAPKTTAPEQPPVIDNSIDQNEEQITDNLF
jgi:penicillin-binding protein 1A